MCMSMLFCIVYHVSEKGWTQVWRGDTNDMYYGYYPLKKKDTTAAAEEKKS